MLMYGNCGCIDAAEVIFQRMPFPNIYSANIMIKVYVTNYELETAKCFFDAMQERNAASWNAIISALTKSGHGKEALQYYHQMLAEGFQPNIITCVSAIDACADERSLLEGMKLHSTALAYGFFDMIVGTALINMYGQCGHLESAWQVHRQITQHDVLSWTAMIAACVHNGCSAKALDMFNQMPERDLAPTTSTFLSVLDGCGSLGELPKCYKIHAQILSVNVISDIRVENALINMYGRCQVPEDATIMFNRMLNRNTVTWSTMIAVFSQNKKNKEAIGLFYQMQKYGANPNNYTVSIILDVCTAMETLEEGQSIYNHSILAGIELDFIAAIAIINMYGKFGRPSDAMVVFRSVEGGVLLWNALMSAYAINGYADEAHQIFEEMKLKGVKPNKASIKILEDLKETLEESLQISNEMSENLLAGDQVILTSIMHQQKVLVT
ncbi:hypothetical protein KP509_22G020200 [Ceratopteris richardii]|nr:hypothetical protein KP509_22G020200 [Ceratopteris richardii]